MSDDSSLNALREFYNLMAVSNAVVHASIDGGEPFIMRPGASKDRETLPGSLLWRYMPKVHFLDLLQTGAAFFARLTVHQVTDPFEGALPYRLAQIHESIVTSKGGDVELFLRERERFVKKFLRVVLVNCWHERAFESRSMWDRYGRGNESVAVVTTFESLRKAMPGRADVGHVDYIDFGGEEAAFSSNPSLRAFQKLRELEDEREVRAVLFDYPEPGSEIEIEPGTDVGYHVPVDLELLVHRVVISPDTTDIIDEIRTEVARRGLSADVVSSAIARKPVY